MMDDAQGKECDGNDYVIDAKNPFANEILKMAGHLGINLNAKEFYLLPIAVYAVQNPNDWHHCLDRERLIEDAVMSMRLVESIPRKQASSPQEAAAQKDIDVWHTVARSMATAQIEQADPTDQGIDWFKRLVHTEREKTKGKDDNASPWLKLVDKNDTYYYNFETKQRSQTLPHFTALKVNLPHMECRDLVMMNFVSWINQKGVNSGTSTSVWENSMKKVFIKLQYHMATEEFEIRWEDGRIDRLKRVQAPHGGTLNCWDLYIGARITIAGREIVLREADPPTRTWLECNARRLLKLRAQVETALRKYEKNASGVSRGITDNTPLININLRKLMATITSLKNRLLEYRPSAGGKFCI